MIYIYQASYPSLGHTAVSATLQSHDARQAQLRVIYLDSLDYVTSHATCDHGSQLRTWNVSGADAHYTRMVNSLNYSCWGLITLAEKRSTRRFFTAVRRREVSYIRMTHDLHSCTNYSKWIRCSSPFTLHLHTLSWLSLIQPQPVSFQNR